ncbi:hypothetical protein KQX54_000364 [Cotesia glomerata]|uniref:Bestrophin homolog n=1 Tax=Cotesia glomerata TaxID=32391 RepID=A0AAV7IIB7_COTGL|nr:hypothetical protein KQX54_000364 [Cotesia glomerata]
MGKPCTIRLWTVHSLLLVSGASQEATIAKRFGTSSSSENPQGHQQIATKSSVCEVTCTHPLRIFEKIRYYFGNLSELISMSFVLEFYVSLVVKRW